MDNFFLGFADEMVKISADENFDSKFKNLLTGAGAAGGAIPLSLLGALAAGKGRRGKGALAGLLGGALLGGVRGRIEAGKSLGMLKDLKKEGKDESFYESLKRQGVSPGKASAKGAAELGSLGALLGLLAGGKGKRLKRALFGGGSGAAIGGLGGLGIGSKALSGAIDVDRIPEY